MQWQQLCEHGGQVNSPTDNGTILAAASYYNMMASVKPGD